MSAHASTAPDRGRSALDGVEAMDAMVNMMREHVPSDARITNAARGAALGTDTKVEVDITGAVWNVLPNAYLAKVMQSHLDAVGGFEYTPAERAFGEAIRKTLEGRLPPMDVSNQVLAVQTGVGGERGIRGQSRPCLQVHDADRRSQTGAGLSKAVGAEGSTGVEEPRKGTKGIR